MPLLVTCQHRVKKETRFFDACCVSKLVYGLQSATLSQVERRRLDGFQCRCLRRVMRIPSSYISRVSNNTVLKRARATKVSQRILAQQMLYFGQLARRDDDDPVRAAVLHQVCTSLCGRKVADDRADHAHRGVRRCIRNV
jgi:hypothetical protein